MFYGPPGDKAGAEKLAAELDKTFPLDTLVQRYWLPTIRAGVALELRPFCPWRPYIRSRCWARAQGSSCGFRHSRIGFCVGWSYFSSPEPPTITVGICTKAFQSWSPVSSGRYSSMPASARPEWFVFAFGTPLPPGAPAPRAYRHTAARRHPGDVAARRSSWMTPTWQLAAEG